MIQIDGKLEALTDLLTTLLNPLLDAYADSDAAPIEGVTPTLLAHTFAHLLELLQKVETLANEDSTCASSNVESQGITELGEYGFTLLDQLSEWLTQLQIKDQQDGMDAAAVTLALWVVRHDGHLCSLERVVDTLARYANRTQQPDQLAMLFKQIDQIISAVTTTIAQDLDKTNPGRPWRVLHLNYAIVATRSHHPRLMEQAFAALIAAIPEDAPRFFSEGMQQMDALNYPDPVRTVMQRYYSQFSDKPALH